MLLRTSRLRLRAWTLADLPAAEAIYRDPEVMRFVDEGEPESPEEVRRSLVAGIAHQAAHGMQHWAVELEGRVIGACGFHRYEGGPDLELVFHFARASWGSGFASEAAAGCLKFAFETLQAERVVAGSHPENRASQRVLEKVGLKFQGRQFFADSGLKEPFYALTAAQWRARGAASA